MDIINLSVCPSVSETAYLFFLKLCMKFGVNKVKKRHGRNFGKNPVIKGALMSKYGVFGHFLLNWSLKVIFCMVLEEDNLDLKFIMGLN